MQTHRIIKIISPVLLLFFGIFLSACLNSAKPPENNPPDELTFSVPNSNINLAKPLEVSNKPEDIALAKKIDEMIDKNPACFPCSCRAANNTDPKMFEIYNLCAIKII